MKRLESSSSEGSGTVYQPDLREHLGKEQGQENNKKERDKKEKDSGVGEESAERVSELLEEYYHGLEDLPWNLNSLEQSLYLSLPQRIKAALLCNLAGQYGIWTFHNNFLPCRLMSYLFLPYTLPATAIVTLCYRLVCWMRQILQKAVRMLTDMMWTMRRLSVFSMLHLKRHLSSRSNYSLTSRRSPSTHNSALSASSCPPSTAPTLRAPNLHPLTSSST
ncbi:1-acylglycerol-3-phosphate O-acyltransferase PNPLA3-like isoform X2 [Colossoma macropomum]|uniref:1-acylglycerol-3-phosphate O-acyltransferase PNPLA3-like isoform X2 n=1 Tax=Colossoma macropomum TaxID=42526 RepID=UPI001864064C|nr:1-acylglycerol-3-phosphate O-acyltransferase PNPLA3-like isoform X2 [Colossoma macropomum]